MLVHCCTPIERGLPELTRSLTSTALATIGRICMPAAGLDFVVEQVGDVCCDDASPSITVVHQFMGEIDRECMRPAL